MNVDDPTLPISRITLAASPGRAVHREGHYRELGPRTIYLDANATVPHSNP